MWLIYSPKSKKMKDWEQLDRERQDFIDLVEKQLSQKIKAVQDKVWLELSTLLAELDTDNGQLKPTARNLSLAASSVAALFLRLSKDSRSSLVKWIKGKIERVLNLNYKYIEFFSPVSETTRTQLAKNIMKRIGIDYVTGKVIKNRSLFLLTSFDSIKATVQNFLESGITSGNKLKDFAKRFKDFFTGGDNQGKVEKEFGEKLGNVFITTSRIAQFDLAKKAKMKYLIWMGAKVEKSRHFCLMRKGQVYTYEFFLKMNEETWKGKKENHNMEEDFGGWGCVDHGAFVSEAIALLVAKGRGGINSFNTVN